MASCVIFYCKDTKRGAGEAELLFRIFSTWRIFFACHASVDGEAIEDATDMGRWRWNRRRRYGTFGTRQRTGGHSGREAVDAREAGHVYLLFDDLRFTIYGCDDIATYETVGRSLKE